MIHEALFDLFKLDRIPAPIRFGNGLINDTYLVYTQGRKGLLQRINHNVFKDVGVLMNNLERVSQHVRKNFPDEIFISVIASREGRDYVVVENNYWRLLNFIPSTHSYESLSAPAQAYEAGKVIGQFHVLLADMEVSGIRDTIPQFHDLSFRISQFHQALDQDKVNRAKDCMEEIQFLNGLTSEVLSTQKGSKMPLRIVHNDTKLNNILFDEEDRGVCMVDLDTMMPGYIVYDTGDALRTMCNPSGEDESQAPVSFNKNVYSKFIEGYFQKTHALNTEEELHLIPFSMIRMSVEQCIRFLTDHLNGDIYFHQPYVGFNYKAVQVQIRFIKLTQQHWAWMEEEQVRLFSKFRS